MAKVSRRTVAEAVSAHLYYTDIHGTKEYVRDRKKYIQSVASYLLETGRTGELDSILRDVSADWARIGYVEVLAHTAYLLDTAARRTIEKLVRAEFPHAKKVIVNERVDESLIGGVRLELVDRQLDLTVRAKLNQFKEGVL
jgi:F0F1-type ATP synthase delta subunit